MHWGLVAWVAGVLLTIYGIKFVFMAIRTLLSKDTMESVMDSMGYSISCANKKFKRYLKNKSTQRKMQKKVEEEKPMIIVR